MPHIVVPPELPVKVAARVASPFKVRVQEPNPVHPAPANPPNVEDGVFAPASVIVVPTGYCAEHVVPQVIPPGIDVTLPSAPPVS